MSGCFGRSIRALLAPPTAHPTTNNNNKTFGAWAAPDRDVNGQKQRL